jgi:protein O-mannosyl-transferase
VGATPLGLPFAQRSRSFLRGGPRVRGATLCLALLVAAAGWFVYSPVLHGRWLWDDDRYITQNAVLREPGALAKIWVAPAGVNYFPVTTTVQWLQWRAWGDDPFGYHVTNVALHVLSGLLLWRLLLQLRTGPPTGVEWLAALLWVVHPLAVESVAWISELKNTLALPFLLLALLGYLRFDDRRAPTFARVAGYGLSLGWFLVAMLSKSLVVMFPVILLGYGGWRRGKLTTGDVVASLPFFAISLALGVITLHFEHHAIGAAGAVLGGPLSRLAGAGAALAFYFEKALLPFRLLPIYPRWRVDPPQALQFLPWLAVAAGGWFLWTKRTAGGGAALLGLGFFVLNLVPILGFVPMAYQRISWVADHFAYLGLPGAIGLATVGIGALQSRLGPGKAWLAGAGALVLCAGLARESHAYSRIFRSADALWTYTEQRNPAAWMAHNNLGAERLKAGNAAAALAEFTEAARLSPSAPEAHANLAVALADLGRLPEAVTEGEAAVRLGPDYGAAHDKLGAILLRSARTADGLEQYRRALQIDPEDSEARENLGDAWYNEGNARAQQGEREAAVADYERALALKPRFPDAEVNLGSALFGLDRLLEAVDHFRAAIRLQPDYAGAHYDLGIALRALGRPEEAEVEIATARHLSARH